MGGSRSGCVGGCNSVITKTMTTKEEILKEATKRTLNINEGSPLHDAVMKAMESYTQQELLAFAEFIDKDLIDNVAPSEIVERFLNQQVARPKFDIDKQASIMSLANKMFGGKSEQ